MTSNTNTNSVASKVTLEITTINGDEYTEKRVIGNDVLSDAISMMRYVRLQIEADPNIAKINLTHDVSMQQA